MLKGIPTEDHAVNNSTAIESRRGGGRYFSVRLKFLRGRGGGWGGGSSEICLKWGGGGH